MRVNLSRGVWIGVLAAAVLFWTDVLHLVGLLQPLLALSEPALDTALLIGNTFMLLLMIYFVVNSGIAMGRLERAVTQKLDDLQQRIGVAREVRKELLKEVKSNRMIRFYNLRPSKAKEQSPE